MKLFILLFSIVIAGELEVDGDLKVAGSVVFQDSSAINTAPKDLPAGILLPYAGNTLPDGWLLCAGQEVNRETYANLFAVIGESYGIGDGSTTFNVPDLRGRMPMGLDNMGSSSAGRVVNSAADSLGGNAGEENHQLTVDQMPSHNHDLLWTQGPGPYTGPALADPGTSNMNSNNLSILNSGGDQPHNNMPPYLSLNYIIKY